MWKHTRQPRFCPLRGPLRVPSSKFLKSAAVMIDPLGSKSCAGVPPLLYASTLLKRCVDLFESAVADHRRHLPNEFSVYQSVRKCD